MLRRRPQVKPPPPTGSIVADTANTLRIALPKGSLQEPTLHLLAKAGFHVYSSSRGLRPSSDDGELDIFMIRAQEIGSYIHDGFLDCGITGYDWVYENGFHDIQI